VAASLHVQQDDPRPHLRGWIGPDPPICERSTERLRIPIDHACAGADPSGARFPGDQTGGATPVPIPNTAVKPAGPMIVPKARKSVIAGIPHETRDAAPSPGAASLFARREVEMGGGEEKSRIECEQTRRR
jgi:hypothetical protein